VPRGKHVVRVCLGTACYVRGGGQVLDALRKRLAINVSQTTDDRMFTLEVARCFGACGLAPTMSVDDVVFKRVRPGKVAEIIDGFYSKGENVKEGARHA
jgi:NADH:ubiquinone oxidoreductase subunit E